jgi:hypothetical protein
MAANPQEKVSKGENSFTSGQKGRGLTFLVNLNGG